jgi:type IV fimbrial biogenesis protein FimT
MRIKLKIRDAEKGFTFIEVVVVMAIMAILAGIAIPMFSVMIPDYKLKQAAQDLYSNLQNAKMEAVRTNSIRSLIFFDPDGQSYKKSDGTTITLASYGQGIMFGEGSATNTMSIDGGFGDYVTYAAVGTVPENQAAFNARGMGVTQGCVYLTNSKKTAYAVCSLNSGVVMIRKWISSSWK